MRVAAEREPELVGLVGPRLLPRRKELAYYRLRCLAHDLYRIPARRSLCEV